MTDLLSTGRLLVDHLRAGVRASALVAFLVTLTVLVVALVPRAFAEVATAELRYQLSQEVPAQLDLHGEGRIGWPTADTEGVPPEAVFGRTDKAITGLPASLPRPLRDGAGDATWILKSTSGTGSIEGSPYVLSLRLAMDLGWTDRIRFVEGEEPGPWAFDPEVEPVDNPIPVALSVSASETMDAPVGTVITYSEGPLLVTGLYEPVDESLSYWSHAYDLDRAAVIRVTGQPPRIQSSVFVPPETAVALPEQFALGILTAWVPIDPTVYEFADLQTLGSQVRNATATPAPLPDFGALALDTTFTEVLDRTESSVAAMTALVALSASGLLGVLLASYALSIQALVRRRRSSLSLAAARGASLRQLRVVMVIEAAVLALPGSAVAIVVAAALVPQRIGLEGWLAPVVLAVVPVILAAVLVAPGSLREERQDLAVRSSSRGRWVLEAAVAGAAVVSLVLLQRRGLVASSDVVGVDPLLAATPVLLAATVGLIALRLYPIPLRALRGAVRRGAAPVAEVGSARAIREPAIGAIASLALVVGVAIVVFSTIMVSTVGTALQRAAAEEVGADVQVYAHDLPQELLDELRSIPGVDGVVALTYRASVTLTDDAGGTKVGVVLADSDDLAAVRPDLPPLGPATSGSLPIAVSPELAARLQGTDLRLGDTPVAVAGVVPETAMPGMLGLWLIADASAIDALDLDGKPPSRLLIDLADDSPPETADAIRAAVLAVQPEQFAGSAEIVDIATELGRARSAPITSGLEWSLLIVAGATLALTMLVVALAAAASAATRNRVVGVLRILGMSPRQVRALVAWEFGPVAVGSMLVGVALGFALPYLVTAVLDLRGFFGGTSLPRPTIDPLWIIVAVGAYALAVLAAVLVATALGRRFAPASTLKMGDA
ncbi:ABC transporter permease [Antiquaquibacter soli]|uniref:ABC transporter permease n=1 Tax=Antiquaquibacter soli TaxID=3064523 RepID=A0ABT9BID3_9MICO|nr:ABC transporter permease [Protaetiibacter sp. WY-16]MDO7880789.1 ABC transporter permease [Protaetiibacter sp. WY-16]